MSMSMYDAPASVKPVVTTLYAAAAKVQAHT